MLIAADGYRYGGRDHDRRVAVAELRRALPSVRAAVVYNRLHADAAWPDDVTPWPTARVGQSLRPAAVPFEHPLWVLFSSGTTGRPKGIVHSTGGILLEHLKAIGLRLDLSARDTFFWSTSPSWMVWNYLVSGLLVGARIVMLRRQPHPPVPGCGVVDHRRAPRHTARNEPGAPACVRRRGAATRPGSRPLSAALDRLIGRGAAGRGLPLRRRTHRCPGPTELHHRRHRRRQLIRQQCPYRAGVARRALRPQPRCGPGLLGPARQARARHGR